MSPRVAINSAGKKTGLHTGEHENAVVYARYSSHSQGEQSIEGQLAQAKIYADAHGYTIIHEYIDRAMTGRNDNRDEFQQMLADTAKKQFTVVILWKIDRFGRNREEIAFNKHICKKNGVRVEYVAEHIPDSPEGIILESVMEGMAEYYSVQLSQNIRRGLLESAKKCQRIGGSVPLGYTVDKQTKKFIIDPNTAPIVQTAFSMCEKGSTFTEICTYLNGLGVKTGTGKEWGKNSLHRMLHNEKYIGVYEYGEIRIEDGIPAIITKETFAKVQEMLKKNKRAPSNCWNYSDFILTDKLFCGSCGSPMVGESGISHTGAKHSYYSCVGKRKEKKCHRKAIRQDVIEPLVLDHIRILLEDDDLLQYIVDQAWAYYQQQDELEQRKAALEKQLVDVQKSVKNIVKAVEAGMFSPALTARMEALEGQRQALEKGISEIDLLKGMQITRDHIEFFLLQMRSWDTSDTNIQKRLVKTFIHAVYVYDDRLVVGVNYTEEGQRAEFSIPLNAPTEGGNGFVCCLPISTCANTYEPWIAFQRGIMVFAIRMATV